MPGAECLISACSNGVSRAEAVGDAISTDRLVALMTSVMARRAFFLDVGDLAVGTDFPVPARDTPACERRKAQQTDETHRRGPQHHTFASGVPLLTESVRRATPQFSPAYLASVTR